MAQDHWATEQTSEAQSVLSFELDSGSDKSVWVSGVNRASFFLRLQDGSQGGWNPKKILGEKKAWSTTSLHIRKCQSAETQEKDGINMEATEKRPVTQS